MSVNEFFNRLQNDDDFLISFCENPELLLDECGLDVFEAPEFEVQQYSETVRLRDACDASKK